MSASALYFGHVIHRRHQPHAHAFRYPVAQLLLDLDELDTIFAGRWLWSLNRRNLAEFRRSDYFGDPSMPLPEAVRRHVAGVRGHRPAGPIRLLTHLRFGGHVFNPVSFYYCYQPDGSTLDCIVADITNTPWKERHAYVLSVAEAASEPGSLRWQFQKRFHVSPFMAMDCTYDWRFSTPGEDLRVHMQVLQEGVRQFDATQHMQRRPLDGRGLAKVLTLYPLMTVQVVAAIHWHALRLWLKRNPVHDHPSLAGKPR
ncbi:DUF1365 domain-containing protein [Stenotrophomonas maltophilia]|jgi:DUF1365 family protein|uniref:Chromosome partitioning protein ParA n=1 Tax=Stenotrophomonas maltophilia TaxID=40324 RepID=A0AAP7L0H5_STEMA|nr:DUF1365 domain-containing protein [Stenotrophomonas maltophilia]MBH1663714.1 DUF1365 domain-containing protein [Stenotrophomonas maltophilia]MCO7397675.1 DUF1365 domain-containing protein [Stenotrophomonas maltophilia]MCO7409868.1 DUF1365 domain-containing protein [Stenotrophomonas maltophilia]OBU61194.1 chromosome partitioning protein ParA [Stenotrophomonas maltophilia]PZT28025.1 chromosome partitioning protein ParA [Stenotrophomonas maltophilia]